MSELYQNSDLFGFLAKPENLRDPYSVYQYLRTNYSVYISEMPPNFLWRRMFCLTRFSDIVSVLKNKNVGRTPKKTEKSEEYNKRLSKSITSQLKDDCVVFIDPPRHTKVRNLISKAMTPSLINNLRSNIEEIAYNLLEDLKGKNEVDLKIDFAYPFPVYVIAELLGVPERDREKLKNWAKYLVKSVDAVPMSKEDYKMLTKSGLEVAQYFKLLIDERRSSNENDLISLLIKSEEDNETLTEGELISNCAFLLIAGHETTMNLITNGTLALLKNVNQLEIFKNDSKLDLNTVEEILRYDSPVQLISRVAHSSFDINEVSIPVGEQIGLFIGSANRDPEVFENPDQLDITRKASTHLAFGHGIHYCLGAPLGRIEGEIAFRTIFDTFPDIKLKENNHQYRPSFSMRELISLNLLI
ncbi:MAG: cytochrome P450 [Candidatus Hodarchaeales archaeon]|jgi:cytochrome P450